MLKVIQSPAKYLQGPDASTLFGQYAKNLADSFFVIADDFVMKLAGEKVLNGLHSHDISCHAERFNGECSHVEINRLITILKQHGCRGVVGIGGGKTLDTAKALAAGADVVHFDVMDNHYVPNLTIGPMVLKSLRNYGITAPIDVHLMVKPVDRIVPDFAAAGASIITFHPEASDHVDRTLQLIKEHGCKAGLVFNPATPLSYLDYVMDKLDVILLMSVNPGFGGQSFIPQTLDKLREVRRRIDESGYDIRLEVDGGVKVNNIGEIAAAGADMFVAGSAIFDQPDYRKVIDEMRSELAKVSHE